MYYVAFHKNLGHYYTLKFRKKLFTASPIDEIVIVCFKFEFWNNNVFGMRGRGVVMGHRKDIAHNGLYPITYFRKTLSISKKNL